MLGCKELRLNRKPAVQPSFSEEEMAIIRDPSIKNEMSPKKVHEVLTMAQLVGSLCKELKIKEVVDIGAGEGYISHMLAKIFGLQVTAIEGNPKIIESGKNRVQTADYWMQRRKEKRIQLSHLLFEYPRSRKICHSKTKLRKCRCP